MGVNAVTGCRCQVFPKLFERRVLADAPAMRVDAPLSLRGYGEDDGDEDAVV